MKLTDEIALRDAVRRVLARLEREMREREKGADVERGAP